MRCLYDYVFECCGGCGEYTRAWVCHLGVGKGGVEELGIEGEQMVQWQL